MPNLDDLEARVQTLEMKRVPANEKSIRDLEALLRGEWMSGRAIFSKALEAAGKVAMHDITPDQITANQNNYNPQGATVLRLSSDASRNITGFDGGGRGRMLIVVNVGSNNIVLKDEDANSTAANRITTHGSADITLSTEDSAMLFYDITSQRWRVLWNSVTDTDTDTVGGSKKMKHYATFANLATRYTSATNGSATVTENQLGAVIDTVTGGTSWVYVLDNLDPTFSTIPSGFCMYGELYVSVVPGSDNPQAGLTLTNTVSPASTTTWTHKHIGLRAIKESGAYNLYATVGDGSTESKTLLTTLAAGDRIWMYWEKNGSGGIDFYYSKNYAAIAAVTTISTNVPSADSFFVCFAASNAGTSARLAIACPGAGVEF